MKCISAYTQPVSSNEVNKNYYTISHANKNGIPTFNAKLPQSFTHAGHNKITVLNFEAIYSDPNNSFNIFRSDCTELHSNIAAIMNYDNQFVCLSGRGFCGYLTYDVSNMSINQLEFKFGNPLFQGKYPIYFVIQLLIEFF